MMVVQLVETKNAPSHQMQLKMLAVGGVSRQKVSVVAWVQPPPGRSGTLLHKRISTAECSAANLLKLDIAGILRSCRKMGS